MGSITKVCAVALALSVASGFAAIQIKVAGGDNITSPATGCALDTAMCCQTHGGAQFRYVGMKCVRDENYTVLRGETCQLNYARGSRPFYDAIAAQVPTPYLVYGKADQFMVPETGTYKLSIMFHLYFFLVIDGKYVAMDKGAGPLEFAQFPGETMGTPVVAEAGQYTAVTEVELTAGDHTFEFYFSPGPADYVHEGRIVLKWFRPGTPGYEVIPESVFGECTMVGIDFSPRNIAVAASDIAVCGTTVKLVGGRSQTTDIAVYSASGRAVQAFRLGGDAGTTADLSSLESGVYVVKARRGNVAAGSAIFARR